jgi:predicted naringenin-chalcone synthase
MSAVLLGIGTGVPANSATQAQALELALRTTGGDEDVARALPALYRRSGVEQRGSVLAGASPGFLAPARDADDRGPGTAARIERYAREAAPLAARASRQAIERASIAPAQVTHLVTVSCTGFDAPGVDSQLIRMLGLSPEVQRTHIGYMGCHGAINGLRLAGAFAAEQPGAMVLVCAVEVCSVHYQYGADPEQIVANALFADGAGAVLIGGAECAWQDRAEDICRLGGCGSYVVPDSGDAMRWRIGDHGFRMMLSPRVPALLSSCIRPWLTRWLARSGLTLNDVRSWCVHPGGPRILSAVGEGLDLDRSGLGPSRQVLAEHGNMSSPSVLFILDRIRRREDPWPCVMLAFGPGLVIEAALLVGAGATSTVS